MNYRDIMNWKGVIFLYEITEPEENSLKIIVNRGKNEDYDVSLNVYGNSMKASPIVTDERLPSLQIEFQSYVSYSVINESFTCLQGIEIFEGEVFRIYKHSRYLDFIKLQTHARDMVPDKLFLHYQIPCLNHVIDVISFDEPKIVEIDKT